MKKYKEHYIIEIATYEVKPSGRKFDENGSGFLPYVLNDKELVCSVLRSKAKWLYDELDKKNKKPRINISYDSDKIFKGGIKVFFKGGYTELRPFALEFVDKLNIGLTELASSAQGVKV